MGMKDGISSIPVVPVLPQYVKKLPVRSGKQPDSADHRLAFSMLLACEFLRIHQRL